jgi:hypothetical protein
VLCRKIFKALFWRFTDALGLDTRINTEIILFSERCFRQMAHTKAHNINKSGEIMIARLLQQGVRSSSVFTHDTRTLAQDRNAWCKGPKP